MELGLKVDKTPFTPICFRSEEKVSFKKIYHSFQDKSKKIRVVIFSPSKISEKKSNSKTQQFIIGPSGVPDSSDFFLFKLFVAKSLVENHKFDIAVVCVYNFSAAFYSIARWLIDERGFKLSQAIQTLKIAFPGKEIDFGISEILKKKYSYDGNPIYFKPNELPVPPGETDLEDESSGDSETDLAMIFFEKDNSINSPNTLPEQPKRKPPKPPPPPSLFGKSKTEISNDKRFDILTYQPKQKAAQPIPSKEPPIKQIDFSTLKIPNENSLKQKWPLPNSSLSPLKQSSYENKHSIQTKHDKASNFPSQQEPIYFINPQSNSQQTHHHHHHHHHSNISLESEQYQPPYDSYGQNPQVQPAPYNYESSSTNSSVYDGYYPQGSDQGFSKPPPGNPNSYYYSNYVPNQSDPYQNMSYDYQKNYYSGYDQSKPQPPFYNQLPPNYYPYDNQPTSDSYAYPPQQHEYSNYPPRPPMQQQQQQPSSYDYSYNYQSNYQYQNSYPDANDYNGIHHDQYQQPAVPPQPISQTPISNDPRNYDQKYRSHQYDEPNYLYPQNPEPNQQIPPNYSRYDVG